MKNIEILLSSHFTLQHLAKMLTRKGTHIPFIEEEKHVRVPKPPTMETRASSLIPIIDEPLVEELTPKSFKATPVVALEADQSSKVAAAQDRLLRMKFLELNKKTKLF